jgi:hypothetical protein
VEEAAPSPARSAPRHPSVAVVARNPNAETDIKKAVNACWQKYPSAPPHSNDPNAPYTATSIFTSELTLDVEDDGLVSQAPAPRFSPTLSPNVFECATAAIYKMRFVEPGRRTIQIRFQQ